MEIAKSIAEAGDFSLGELEKLFSELANNGCSLMIRSDVQRPGNVYTCAIALRENPERSVRRDAATLKEAVILCLRSYLSEPD